MSKRKCCDTMVALGLLEDLVMGKKITISNARNELHTAMQELEVLEQTMAMIEGYNVKNAEW